MFNIIQEVDGKVYYLAEVLKGISIWHSNQEYAKQCSSEEIEEWQKIQPITVVKASVKDPVPQA